MPPSVDLPAYGRVYVSVVIALGVAVVASSVVQLWSHPVPVQQWFLLAALTLISGSATVKLPSIQASISVSETFVFTAVLLYGPAAGTLIVALDGLVMSFWIARRIREPHRALFNMSAPALSAWASAHLFFLVAGISPLDVAPSGLDRILPSLVVFAATYFGLNSWLIAIAIAAQTRANPLTVWRNNFIWLSLNYFCGASVAILLVVYTRNIDIRFVGVIVPLLFVLYFTFKTSMGRVEDANRHVDEVNKLYLSTIETLAMAIDAKDQITHGHIRRVQEYALGLARRVGVADPTLIKAIEAAALLHDMGKLAVPEYILNKPGKLTAAEFEKMKLHSSVGADILSAIDFPYPVVPIVRHHHEYWDGNGYPAGLKGTDIPIGARILAVVDCFDALTSDRPYRPRLSDREALQILTERRGSIYDPLIVDTFARVHAEIAPVSMPISPSVHVLNHIASTSNAGGTAAPSRQFDQITEGANEMLAMYEFAGAVAAQSNVNDIGDAVAACLRRLVPFALCVVYLYDAATDGLEALYASGEGSSIVKGLKMSLGRHLSGWVAANRQTIVNSDPTLDLGTIARFTPARLRSCLSTPMLDQQQLVGVLTLYATGHDFFAEEHRRIVETVAQQAAHAFRRAVEIDGLTQRDALTGLPNVKQLEQILTRHRQYNVDSSVKTSLLFIDVVNLEQVNISNGRAAGDDCLRYVVEQIRSALRPSDLLFRYGSDEFVALLSVNEPSVTAHVATRILDNVVSHRVLLPSGASVSIEVTATEIRTPDGEESLIGLVSAARSRGNAQGPHHGGGVH
jgi:diguanylate cyclase (GGDEF)-like protein/putative nucleotidyltransferase with HDIG domain